MMMLRTDILRILCTACLFSLSGPLLAVPLPTSQEFLSQYGLSIINVLPAWNSATGSGVVVASLDTGANASHFELAGKIVSGGSNVDIDGSGGHGTSVAGLIAASFNNAGMIGVAYDAKVLPIGIADSNRFATSSGAAAGFDQAAGRSDVGIISFSVGTTFAEPLNSSILNAMNAGKAVILRAGNGGQSEPDIPPSLYNQFNGRGMIVGAYDAATKTTAAISNKAGSAANVYLLVPGVGIYAPGNTSDDSFVRWTGASVATAQAAGAAALVLSQNPGLSNQQVVEILLNSATDLGAPGVDAITGHGLLNVGAAISAQGDLESSSSSSGGGAGVALAAVAVGGGLAYFWTQNQKAKKQLEKTLVFDGYDRPYIMNLNQTLHVRNNTPSLFDVMDMFDRQTRGVDIAVSDNLALSLHANTTNPTDYIFLKESDPFLDDFDRLRDEDLSMKMAGKFNNGLSFNLQHNYAPASAFDEAGPLALSENFIWASSFGSQYLGFGALADSMSIGYQPNKKLAFQLGANHLDDGEIHGLSSDSAMLQGSYFPNEKTSISLRLSNLYEDGSLLGGASEGVFSVANASTTAIGLTGNYQVSKKLSLYATLTEGFTDVKAQSGSFLQSFSGLRSQSWSTGVIGSDLFRYHDRAGIAISSPLHVQQGDADLVVPQSLDEFRQIQSSRTRVSLAPAGSEIDVEAFYRMNLNQRTQLGTTLAYRDAPADANYDGSGLAVFTTVGMRF